MAINPARLQTDPVAVDEVHHVVRIETRDSAGKVISVVFEIDGSPSTAEAVRVLVARAKADGVKLTSSESRLEAQ